MDDLDLIRREGGRTIGRLQWPNGGAMARKIKTLPEFTALAIPTIIRQTESIGRE
jgi:hypothetical protein